MRSARLAAVTTALVACFAVTHALAQTTSVVNSGVQFDFSLPGAKSLAMGGSFVALADDATAAQANPAGLTRLPIARPQISIEGRGWNFFTLTPHGGHAFGAPTWNGVDGVLAPGRWPRAGAELAGVEGLELNDTTRSVSLVTLVYPAGGWVLAGYRHQLLNLVNRTESAGPFVTLPSGDVARLNPFTGRIEADIATYGMSVARGRGDISVGGGIGFSTFSIASRAQSFLLLPHNRLLQPNERAGFTQAGDQFGPADFSDQKTLFIDEQIGDDTALSYNLGMSVRLGDMLQLGGSFRKGPMFRYNTRFAGGPGQRLLSGSPGDIDRHEGIRFHVPDSYAVGLALFPANSLTLTFEYDYIRYEQILNGGGDGLPVETAGQSRSADPKVVADGLREVQALAIDNAHQARAGVEWRVLTKGAQTLLLRAGGWYDPDHRLRSETTDPTDLRLLTKAVLLPRGSDEGHFSFGGGLLFGEKVQLDAGVDLSPRVNTLAVSAVVYFQNR